jgi:hypothetical protein
MKKVMFLPLFGRMLRSEQNVYSLIVIPFSPIKLPNMRIDGIFFKNIIFNTFYSSTFPFPN